MIVDTTLWEREVPLMVRCAAYELLGQLLGNPLVPATEYVARDGVAVRIEVGPPEQLLPRQVITPAEVEWRRPSNTCERQLLAVLAALEASPERRFTVQRIKEEMAQRGMRHGACTLARALARLVRVGHLVNDRDRKGYGLASSSTP